MMEAARLLESSLVVDGRQFVRGFRGIGELGNVVEGLQKRGFSEEDTRKFLGGNFRRVFERVWRAWRAWRNDA